MMIEVLPIPAFRDNYIWLLRRGGHAAVVDPGDAEPVLEILRSQRLILDAILVTHHHDDHVGGIPALLQSWPATVHAPRRERYAFAHNPVGEGDVIRLETLDVELRVMETPGHTLGHVVYYGANSLFCGDTLFGCGCGRLFEGNCAQLHQSLQRLAALPSDTALYCAHEYTLHNIRFARILDPANTVLAQREQEVERLRAAGVPSLPSTIGLECATNPFLRCDDRSLQAAVGARTAMQGNDPQAVFCALRTLRNSF